MDARAESRGAVWREGVVRVSREDVDAGRAYPEFSGYADALRAQA